VTVDATVESSIDFTSAGATTHHHLVIDPPASAAAGSIELIADGEFGVALESVQADAEGLVSLGTGAIGTVCAPARVKSTLSAVQVAGLTVDGSVDVSVTNSFYAVPSCPINRHTVRLHYQAPAVRLDFGEVRAGAKRGLSITVKNPSAFARTVQITSDSASFVPNASPVVVSPLGFVQTMVRFAPANPGAIVARLTLTGDLPGDAPWSIDLAGVGVAPPNPLLRPDALSAVVPAGGSQHQSFTIGNLGERALDFDLRVERPGQSGVRRAVVLDGNPPSLVVVDLESGEKVRVGLGQDVSGAEAVALDPSGHRAYLVVDAGGLYSVDLDTGRASVVGSGFAGVAALAISRDG
jgi:hypothetical protein